MRTRTVRAKETLSLGIALVLWLPCSALGTVGWENEDIILDFGSTVEDGEPAVLLDHQEFGVTSFDLELTWRLNPDNCRLLATHQNDDNREPQERTVSDDGIFNGNPAHTHISHVFTVRLQAKPGHTCSIEANHDEFIVMAKAGRAEVQPTQSATAPLGTAVIVMRATAFFTPSTVTVKAGEKVVWIYADGAHEPHSVTSGDCRDLSCTGGGEKFNSGPTLTKPGHRFEHVFTQAGTYPYHCILHLGSMQGTVIVEP